MEQLHITRMDSEELSYRTKVALLDIIRENGKDGAPFKLPNEDELSQRLGVSRNVLRDALMSLEEMGVVTRRRSKGTIANPKIATAVCRLDTNPELFCAIRDSGYEARVETIRLGFVFEPDAVLEGDEMYLNVEKLFYADDLPAAFCADHLSGRLTAQAGENILALRDLSHYHFLETYCGTSLAYTMANIDATLPPPWLAELMQLEPGEPVLVMDDSGYNYDHELVVHSNIYFRRNLLHPKFLRKSW